MPKYDIEVNQFATFKLPLSFTDATGIPLDISAWSFTGSIRPTFTDPPLMNFTISVISLASASIMLRLDPSQTSQLENPKYLYDVIAYNVTPNPDEVYRMIEGKVKVNPGVTIDTTP